MNHVETSQTEPYHAPPAIDFDELMVRLDGDAALFQEIAQLFLENSAGMLDAIRRAAELKDGRALQRAAHTLKGCVANLAASRLVRLSAELEQAGRQGDFSRAAVVCRAAGEEMLRVEAELRTQSALRR